MWYKIFKVEVNNNQNCEENCEEIYELDVICYYDVDEASNGLICFRSMLNEFLLTFEIYIPADDRNLAYSLIENFPLETLSSKMEELAYENGAFE